MGVQMEKVHVFHFPLGIDLHSYFYATFALLKDCEIFDNFDYLFKHFSTLKVCMTRLG